MGILPASEVQRLLHPYEPEFASSIRAAWSQYRQRFLPALALPPARRFRANAMSELMAQEVKRRMSERVVERRGRVLVHIAPGLVATLKKLDDRGLPQNYPTQTALAFVQQMPIAGIPAGTRVVIGYQLNKLGTEISELAVVLQRGSAFERWEVREERVNVVPMAQAAEPRRRSRVKQGILKERKKSDDSPNDE